MPTYSRVLHLLSTVLIEIRASENIDKAQILSDVVHNVPSMIRSDSPESEIIAKVMCNAKRLHCEDYIENLLNITANR